MKLREFKAAKYDRTLEDWVLTLIQSFNEELETDLEALRSRSRDASVNNEYVRRYFKALRVNVIGKGIEHKNRSRNIGNGKLDRIANKKIEDAWRQWSRYATIDGCSLREASKLVLETVARDGEIITLFRKGPQYGPFQFQLQFLDADYLDVRYNLTNRDPNIRMSIKNDSLGRPVSYYIYTQNPTDRRSITFTEQYRQEIPARLVLHLFSRERPGQMRGFPWIPAALLVLKHIYEYRKSEMIASRLASMKSAAIRKPLQENDQPQIGDEVDHTDDRALLEDIEGGKWPILPPGYDITPIDFQNPNARFKEFTKVLLMGAAASLGISYSTLTGDLESTSYSSLRQGAIDERETYKDIQQWFCESFLDRVFEEWLRTSIQVGAIDLPIELFDKWNQPEWRPRTWQLIDPAKETNSLNMQLQNRIRSLRDVVRDQGRELEDVLDEIAEEEQMMRDLGIERLLNQTELQPEQEMEDENSNSISTST